MLLKTAAPKLLWIFFCVHCAATVVQGQEKKEVTNSIGMKFVWIKNGTFTMGSPESEKGRLIDESAHMVTISKDYYLSIHETTQAQYRVVMGENNSYFQGSMLETSLKEIDKSGHLPSSDSFPADSVSWYDAQEFCRKLSELPEEKTAQRVYRLPTEAEWEYACRAGNQSSYSFGESSDLLPQYAWFRENSNKMPHPVGQKKPNAWGLFDMYGNVCEWCADQHRDYPAHATNDPFQSDDHSPGILRGGDWRSYWMYCRSAARVWEVHSRERIPGLGFRVLLEGKLEPSAENTSEQSDTP